MEEAKSKLHVVLDKKGELIAASFAPPMRPGAFGVTPTPIDPTHTLHEIEVSHELAASPTFEKLHATVKAYTQALSKTGVKATKPKGEKS